MIRFVFSKIASVGLVVVLGLSEIGAQEITAADELVRQLDVESEPNEKPKVRTRGIVIDVPNVEQGRASLNSIEFEYDSDRLTPDSVAQLSELGKALAHERLSGENFIIEGHADAFGDDQYNKDLSYRRAMTVRDYLTKNLGIAEERLQAIGMGEEKPKTDNPYDPENRRVDVVNVKAYE